MLSKKDTVGGIVWRQSYQLSDEDFLTLEDAATVSFDGESRQKIELSLDRYILKYQVSKASPDAQKEIDRAEYLLKVSKEFEEFFRRETNVDKALVSRIKTVRDYWDIECGLTSAQFLFLNNRLCKVIERLSLKPLSKAGPGENDSFNTLIADLLLTYKEAFKKSKKLKSRGQTRFITAALQLLPENVHPHVQSDEALKQRIKRVAQSIQF